MSRAALPFTVLAVLVIAVLALAAVAGASPQPSPICGFCGDRFEDTADDRGVNATIAESTVTVQIHENGSATWTVRNRLANGSDRFHDDPSRLADVARSLADGSRGVVDEVQFVSARMDGDTAVLVFRDADAAERHAGILVVDYLHDRGYERWYVVDADVFTIRGPAGTVVSNDPESGVVEGHSVTWRGDSTGESYEAPDLEGSPYVVFGPDRSAETGLRTRAALALSTLPIVVRSAGTFLFPQVPVFALALGAVVYALRRRQPGVGVESIAVAIATLSGLVGVATAVVWGPGTVPGPAAFGVLVGGFAAHQGIHRYLRTPREQGLVAAGALAITLVSLLATYAVVSAYDDPATVALRSTALAFPFAAMLPLGGVVDVGGRRLLRWSGVAVVAFAAIPLTVVNFADPPSRLGAGLAAMAFLLAAVFFPVLGGLVVALGQGLSRERPTGRPADRSTTRQVDDL